ncbi:hypothetical protein FQA39_LY19227 [Lamprigera yunnana]|nr:hypothetical protein FQA39_LY19227 [Lamprigera yunnana]
MLMNKPLIALAAVHIKDNTNIDTGVVENTIDAPIAGSSFANRHDSGKCGHVEDRAVPIYEYNFDSIFNMDDSEMDIQNDMDHTINGTGNRAGVDSSKGSDTVDNDIPNFSSHNVQQAKDGLVQISKCLLMHLIQHGVWQ